MHQPAGLCTISPNNCRYYLLSAALFSTDPGINLHSDVWSVKHKHVEVNFEQVTFGTKKLKTLNSCAHKSYNKTSFVVCGNNVLKTVKVQIVYLLMLFYKAL